MAQFRSCAQAILAIIHLAEQAAKKKALALTRIEPRLQAQETDQAA